jgi:hypothetical protein
MGWTDGGLSLLVREVCGSLVVFAQLAALMNT